MPPSKRCFIVDFAAFRSFRGGYSIDHGLGLLRHFSLLRNLANGVLVKPLNVRPQPRQRFRGNPFALPHKITSRFAQCGHPMPTTRRWPTSATEPNPERLGFGGAGGSTEPSNSGMIVEFRSVTAASIAQPQYSHASASRLAIASAKASDRNASRRCDGVSLAVPTTHSRNPQRPCMPPRNLRGSLPYTNS